VLFAGAELPENLAEHAENEFGIARGEMETANQSTQLHLGNFRRARLEIAGGAERIEERAGNPLDFAGGSEAGFFRAQRGAGAARQFVQADGHSLAQIHRAVLDSRGNANQPMTMAEVLIGQANFFRAEEQGDAAGAQPLADQSCAGFERPDGLLEYAPADRGCADNEGAVGNGFRQAGEFARARQNGRGANRGTRLTKCRFERIHKTQIEKSKIAHGASGRADIERVARGDEHNAETVEFNARRQWSSTGG